MYFGVGSLCCLYSSGVQKWLLRGRYREAGCLLCCGSLLAYCSDLSLSGVVSRVFGVNV